MKEQTKHGIIAMLKQQAAAMDKQLAQLTEARQFLSDAIEETEKLKCED